MIVAYTIVCIVLIAIAAYLMILLHQAEKHLVVLSDHVKVEEAQRQGFDQEAAVLLEEVVSLRTSLLDFEHMKSTLVIVVNDEEVARYYLDCSRLATHFESLAENTLPRVWSQGGEFTIPINLVFPGSEQPS